MNDRAILKKYGYDEESTSIKEMEIEVGNMLKDARQDEREKILNFIGKLKISDEFHEFWNDETSDGSDVLNNTLDMVIREIREEKSACGKPSCDMGSCDSICEKEEVKK